MLVFDENIPASQRQLLHKSGLHLRVIGIHTATLGTSDENLIPVLHGLPQPTFFSQDAGFFKRSLCHARYALVHLDVSDSEIAEYTRAYLKHPAFETNARRMGTVARLRPRGIQFWRKGEPGLKSLKWERL
jgi:hypothetical protein